MILSKRNTSAVEEQDFDGDAYVVDFLRDTPDFFARNPELLMELEVPHRPRGTVSLVERRLSLQREQFNDLQQRMSEIVDVAHQNDHLSELLHDYSIGLMSATSLAEVFEFTREVLKQRLQCEMSSAIILRNEVIEACSDGLSDYVQLADASVCSSMNDLHLRRSVYCGYPISNRVEQFFPGNASQVKSIAIIRLVASEASNSEAGNSEAEDSVTEFGYLALASDNKKRFAPHLGSDFLARLGSLLSARLAVFY